MSLGPLLRLLVKSLHVGLQLATVHAPDAATADLDRGELPGANQRIDLRNAYRQIDRHIVKGEETRLYLGSAVAGFTGLSSGHRSTIAPDHDRYLHLAAFAAVCRHWVRGGVPCR